MLLLLLSSHGEFSYVAQDSTDDLTTAAAGGVTSVRTKQLEQQDHAAVGEINSENVACLR